jgi:hypothetical protein
MTTIYPEREKLQQLEFVQNNQTLWQSRQFKTKVIVHSA